MTIVPDDSFRFGLACVLMLELSRTEGTAGAQFWQQSTSVDFALQDTTGGFQVGTCASSSRKRDRPL